MIVAPYPGLARPASVIHKAAEQEQGILCNTTTGDTPKRKKERMKERKSTKRTNMLTLYQVILYFHYVENSSIRLIKCWRSVDSPPPPPQATDRSRSFFKVNERSPSFISLEPEATKVSAIDYPPAPPRGPETLHFIYREHLCTDGESLLHILRDPTSWSKPTL